MPSTRKELWPPNGERPQRRRRRRLAMLSWRRTTTLCTAPVRFCPPKRSSNSFQKVNHAVFHTTEHNHVAHTPIFAPRSTLQSAYAFKNRPTTAAKRMGKTVGAILAARMMVSPRAVCAFLLSSDRAHIASTVYRSVRAERWQEIQERYQ